MSQAWAGIHSLADDEEKETQSACIEVVFASGAFEQAARPR